MSPISGMEMSQDLDQVQKMNQYCEEMLELYKKQRHMIVYDEAQNPDTNVLNEKGSSLNHGKLLR